MKSGRIGSRTIKPILTKLKAARVQISHITSPVLYTLLCAVRIMKNILSIMAFIIGLIAIPIQIIMIAENNQRILFIILMCLTLPGFINSIRHLMKKVHFKVDFRIDE